jgi:hypothetical protein
MKKSTNDRLLASAHKVAKALHEVGAMDEVTMGEMDRLCLPPPPDPSDEDRRRRMAGQTGKGREKPLTPNAV